MQVGSDLYRSFACHWPFRRNQLDSVAVLLSSVRLSLTIFRRLRFRCYFDPTFFCASSSAFRLQRCAMLNLLRSVVKSWLFSDNLDRLGATHFDYLRGLWECVVGARYVVRGRRYNPIHVVLPQAWLALPTSCRRCLADGPIWLIVCSCSIEHKLSLDGFTGNDWP